jgi:hypothetical protein
VIYLMLLSECFLVFCVNMSLISEWFPVKCLSFITEALVSVTATLASANLQTLKLSFHLEGWKHTFHLKTILQSLKIV